MPINLHTISLKRLLKIKKQILDNAEEIRQEEQPTHCYNLPYYDDYRDKHLKVLLEQKLLNEKNFRSNWLCEVIVENWNTAIFGEQYNAHKKKYKKMCKNPADIQRLKDVYEHGGRSWGYIWKKTRIAIDAGEFLSFWQFYTAYEDTKGSWRHWWDALQYDKKFSVGDIAELRCNATHNNVFTIVVHHHNKDYKYLQSVYRNDFRSLRGKAFMVIGYDQQKPDKTYSYKKAKGSHRLVTILPVGSAKVYYIPEQFLKISRKKAVRDAKGHKT